MRKSINEFIGMAWQCQLLFSLYFFISGLLFHNLCEVILLLIPHDLLRRSVLPLNLLTSQAASNMYCCFIKTGILFIWQSESLKIPILERNVVDDWNKETQKCVSFTRKSFDLFLKRGIF